MGDDSSLRQTATLAALGLLAAGESGARAGLRAASVAAGPSLAVWRSWPLAPARGLTAPVVDALVSRGRREQARWQDELEWGVTERAVGVAVDHALVERATAELLESGVLEHVGAQIAASPLPLRLVESPELQQVIDRALDSPALERLLVRVMQSGLVDELTEKVLASEELQRIVEHIAQSEEVRRALTAQPAGLAGEVAGAVRSRSAVADDAAERLAHRLLHRHRPRPGPLGPEPG
jgi:hypothetical protein